MIGFRSVSVGLYLALALTVAGCSDSDSPTSPSPTPTPTPAPTPAVATSFTITGTVSESEPSADFRLSGARVTLSTGQTAETNSQGAFTFTNIPAGAYIATATRSNYGDQSLTITLPAESGKRLDFHLTPDEATIEVEANERLSQEDQPCHGSVDPCKEFGFGVHHSGTVDATLEWNTSDADFDLVLICGDEVVAQGEATSTVSEAFTVDVEAGHFCVLRVVHDSGAPDRFILSFTHPN